LHWVVVALTHTLACSTATTTTNDGITDAVQSAGGDANSDDTTTADFCSVERVLQNKCQRCHSDPPLHGAPFALVTYADTQAPDHRGQPRYLTLQEVVANGTMPATFLKLEPPVMPLEADEKQLLLDWCAAAAPPGDCP
jgi:uncharacterized membrane protein